jgi:hypothetical protein
MGKRPGSRRGPQVACLRNAAVASLLDALYLTRFQISVGTNDPSGVARGARTYVMSSPLMLCLLFGAFKVRVRRALNLESEGFVCLADGVGAEVGYRRPNRIVRAASLFWTVTPNKLQGKPARSVQDQEPFPLGTKSTFLFAVLILFDVRDKRPGSYGALVGGASPKHNPVVAMSAPTSAHRGKAEMAERH